MPELVRIGRFGLHQRNYKTQENLHPMTTARNKINAAAILGAVIFAGIIALLAGGWPVFWLMLIVLLITSFLDGSIRFRGRR